MDRKWEISYLKLTHQGLACQLTSSENYWPCHSNVCHLTYQQTLALSFQHFTSQQTSSPFHLIWDDDKDPHVPADHNDDDSGDDHNDDDSGEDDDDDDEGADDQLPTHL